MRDFKAARGTRFAGSGSVLAIAIAGWMGLDAGSVLAGAGHDHSHDAAPIVASGNAPQRLPDGSVFLPKPAQRQLTIRTIIAEKRTEAQALEFRGRVVPDPNAAGKVQSTLAGRIEAGPRGLPNLGQTVKQGEVLAYVRPSASTFERANQAAQAAELRANLAMARNRLGRAESLDGIVPRKEIEQARAEVQGLTERLSSVGPSLSTREPLVAPVSGVVAAANIVAGQVIEARELLIEIVDPRRLAIEALTFDPALATQIAGASVAIEGKSVPLAFVGAGRALKEGALPMFFRLARSEALPVAVGQPVSIAVRTRTAREGVPIPRAALVKSPANQDIVWLHPEPEQFVARTVRFEPLDAERVIVIDGIEPGARVVTDGASLLNQIR